MKQIYKKTFLQIIGYGCLLLHGGCSEPEAPAHQRLEVKFIAGIHAETRTTDNGLQTSFMQGDCVHLSVCETNEGAHITERFAGKLLAQTSGYQNIAFTVHHHDEATKQPLFLTEEMRKARFFALYPDKAEEQGTTPGEFIIRIAANQQNNGYTESDYMGAMQQGITDNSAEHPASVTLSFKHILSKIVFRLIPASGKETPELAQATVVLYKQTLQGTYNFLDSPAFEASITENDKEIIPKGRFEPLATHTGGICYEGVKAIVPPQFIKNGTHLFSVFIDGVEYPYQPNESEGGIWLQSGMQQRFTITARQGSIEVSTSINAWGDGGSTTGDAEN